MARSQRLCLPVRGRRVTKWVVVVGALALLSTLPLAGPAQADLDVARWLARADRLAERGHPQRAAALVRRIGRRAPAHPGVAERLGRWTLPQQASPRAVRPPERLRERATEVRETADAALEQPPEERARRRSLRRTRAWAVAIAGDHREGIEEAGAAMGRLDGAAASLLRRLATLAIRRHDLEAADRALELARRADPQDESLLSDRAAVALARGRPGRAVTLLRRALSHRPESVPLRRDLGGALLAAGRADEAVEVLAAVARECDGRAGRCHLDLARAALEANAPQQAADAAREALERAPKDDPEPAVLLGLALVAKGQPARAERALRRALARDPDHVRARRALEGLRSDPSGPETTAPGEGREGSP